MRNLLFLFLIFTQTLTAQTSLRRVAFVVGNAVYEETNFISDFFRLNYDYKEKILVQASVRRDGSSVFGKNKEWGYFPAAAVAWRISQEKFLENVSWLNNLKLRLSYGEVGNDGINANLWKTQWSADGLTRFSINEIQQGSYSPASTIANPNLKWETTTTKNLGVDFSLFDNRLFGALEVYKNKDARALDPELKKVAISTFLLAILLSLCLIFFLSDIIVNNS